MEFTNFTIGENDANRRLDRVIRKMLPAIPLSKIYSLIRHGSIRLNGKKTSQSTQLIQGDILQVSSYFLKSAAPLPSSKLSTSPDKLPPPIRLNSQKAKVVASHLPHLAIIYKDADFLILDKPRNVLVHGRESLDSAVKSEYFNSSSQSPQRAISFAPGPLHRLDGGTSGIVVFSQSLKGAQTFSAALQSGNVLRFYKALVVGHFSGTAEFKSPVDGKPAHTKMQSVRYLPQYNLTLVEIQIFTGRKHQIRIHCAANGFPLFGDKTSLASSKSPNIKGGYFLHFAKMQCRKKILNLPEIISAPLPSYFEKYLFAKS